MLFANIDRQRVRACKNNSAVTANTRIVMAADNVPVSVSPADARERALAWARSLEDNTDAGGGVLKRAHRRALAAMAATRGLAGTTEWTYTSGASCAAHPDTNNTPAALRWWNDAARKCVAGDAASVQWCDEAGALDIETDAVSGVARCRVNEAYCRAKGTYYVNGDCRVDFSTWLLEQLVGVTVSRGINYVLDNPDRVLEEITLAALNASGLIYDELARPVLDVIASGELQRLPAVVLDLGLKTAAYTVTKAGGAAIDASTMMDDAVTGISGMICKECGNLAALLPPMMLARLSRRALQEALGVLPSVMDAMSTGIAAVTDALDTVLPVGAALDAMGVTPILKDGVALGTHYGGVAMDYAKDGVSFAWNNGVAVGLREVGNAHHLAKKYAALGMMHATDGLKVGFAEMGQAARHTSRGYSAATGQIRRLPGGEFVMDRVDAVGRAFMVPEGMNYVGKGLGIAGDAATQGLGVGMAFAGQGLGVVGGYVGDGLNAAGAAVGGLTQHIDLDRGLAYAGAGVRHFMQMNETREAAAVAAAAAKRTFEAGLQAAEYGKQAADALSELHRLQDAGALATQGYDAMVVAADVARREAEALALAKAQMLAELDGVRHMIGGAQAAYDGIASAVAGSAAIFADAKAREEAALAAAAFAATQLSRLDAQLSDATAGVVDMQARAAEAEAAYATVSAVLRDAEAQKAAALAAMAVLDAELRDATGGIVDAEARLADAQAAYATAAALVTDAEAQKAAALAAAAFAATQLANLDAQIRDATAGVADMQARAAEAEAAYVAVSVEVADAAAAADRYRREAGAALSELQRLELSAADMHATLDGLHTAAAEAGAVLAALDAQISDATHGLLSVQARVADAEAAYASIRAATSALDVDIDDIAAGLSEAGEAARELEALLAALSVI